jgi:hypothetical protein
MKILSIFCVIVFEVFRSIGGIEDKMHLERDCD